MADVRIGYLKSAEARDFTVEICQIVEVRYSLFEVEKRLLGIK
jgi:hypothetical protein